MVSNMDGIIRVRALEFWCGQLCDIHSVKNEVTHLTHFSSLVVPLRGTPKNAPKRRVFGDESVTSKFLFFLATANSISFGTIECRKDRRKLGSQHLVLIHVIVRNTLGRGAGILHLFRPKCNRVLVAEPRPVGNPKDVLVRHLGVHNQERVISLHLLAEFRSDDNLFRFGPFPPFPWRTAGYVALL
jgi:hypothetical protein